MTDATTTPHRQLPMFDLPELQPAEPAPIAVDLTAPPPEVTSAPPRHVSAARAVRALQRSLPVVATVEPDPPGYEGWRERLGEAMPRIAGGVCEELADRRRPDGTLAPCPRVRCPHHLAVDVGERVDLGPIAEAELVASTAGLPVEMGRRPSLSAIPETAGEVHDFADAVIARLDGRAAPLPWSCTLDVVAAYPDGAPVAVIAEALGVSEEVARLDTRRVTALLFDERHEDAWANLEAAARRREHVRRIVAMRAPSKIADPLPMPVAIVRVEREAPAPRERTADEIFGEGW